MNGTALDLHIQTTGRLYSAVAEWETRAKRAEAEVESLRKELDALKAKTTEKEAKP